MTHWLLLGLGIVLEVVGTACMKASAGLSRPGPSVLMFVFYGLSLSALSIAMRSIDLSVGYAVWSAAGTMLIVAIGVAWFGEPMSMTRALWIGVILAGIIGLRTT